MYNKLKSTPKHSTAYLNLRVNLRIYNKILNTSINEAKSSYYHRCFENAKNDMKRQWSTINEILHKQTKKTYVLDHFVIDGKQITDQKAISNTFNNYFVNIGPNLAANIKLPNSKSFKNFLRNPTSHKFNLTYTNKENVQKIIDRLHPKNSCGPDGISVKLLKEIKHDIIKPVTLITNQCILSGVFTR